LSFHMTDYGNQVQETISYFITEILNTADALILVTPLKIYRLNVSANKEKMITDIDKLLKNDCHEFKKKLNASKKNLEIQMNRMMQLFRGEIRDPGLATSYKIIGTFLSSFPQGFLNFRNLFLYPDMKNYQKVLGFLGTREGEGWWIHFQQGDSFGIFARAQMVTKEIDDYFNHNDLARQSFQNNLRQLEKMFQLADSFPGPGILNTFTNGSIRYNTILWMHHKQRGSGAGPEIIGHLGTILNRISKETGGKTVHTTDPEQGMKEIRNHRDCYYQLTCNFDGNIEEKKVNVTTAANIKELKLFYKDHFTGEEIGSLVRYLSKERVQIIDFSLNKNTLKFAIKSITLNKNKGESFGLVKVRIELLGSGEAIVYRTENTLRSSKQRITVSLPLPGQHKGTFKLVITACDLMANQLASFKREVILK
ncbi:MAG: hypothetical protein JSV88_12295, partial [Candidatus Aminicenantes bacterium]